MPWQNGGAGLAGKARRLVGSHVLVGAAPGTAMETAGSGDGWLRAAPDWRTLGLAVDTILWEHVSGG